MGFRMPAEWAPHARTIIGWPCRPDAWGDTLEQGRAEFATIANAIAAFEPVTMVCASEADAEGARAALRGDITVTIHPMDGAWLRDNGPVYVTDGARREARHFRFNAWGERHAKRDRDAALGAALARELGDPVVPVDVVLEGGAIATDGAGTLVTTEGCLMHPNRNWQIDRDEVTSRLSAALGLERVVWLPQGLAEDQVREDDRMYYGTDGHIDLFCAFTGEKRVLLLEAPGDDPNAGALAEARGQLEAAGIAVTGFPFMSGFEAGGHRFIAPYLNFYVCNGAVIVPVAGAEPDKDREALATLARHWPGREIVPVTMHAGPMQGGAVHCATQQVPAVP